MSQLRAIVDKLLTNTSSMYIPDGFVSETLFPFIGVKQSTGKLTKYGNNHLRIENSTKGGRGKFREVNPIVRSTSTYQIEGHGLEGMVTKDDYRNVEAPFDAEKDETMGVSTMLWVEKEKVLADGLALTLGGVTLTGTAQYNNYGDGVSNAPSNPIQDFQAARLGTRAGSGALPDTVLMSWEVYQVVRYHPALLKSLGDAYNRPGGLSDQELATVFGVRKLVIANAMYNAAKEGQADNLQPIWGKNIYFLVCPDQAAPYQISTGYRLGYAGEQPRQVYKQDQFNPPGSTRILVEDNYDFVISNQAAGYAIKNAIA